MTTAPSQWQNILAPDRKGTKLNFSSSMVMYSVMKNRHGSIIYCNKLVLNQKQGGNMHF